MYEYSRIKEEYILQYIEEERKTQLKPGQKKKKKYSYDEQNQEHLSSRC